MANQSFNPPPREVLVEFLHALQQTISPYDLLVPVLRGSTLMQHWFGSAARPAADIDLEWFPQPGSEERFRAAIEHARMLCMHTVSNHEAAPIVFDEDVPVPDGGVNLALWEYDNPGVRCYIGWRWDDRNLSGFLQIDIAQAGSYELAGVATETIVFPRAWGEAAQILGYSQEMLLAAKLSWIVRHIQDSSAAQGGRTLVFDGEPKDVFDAHLLLTNGNIRPDGFQNAFLAVALEDNLDWSLLDLLVDSEVAFDVEEKLREVITLLRPLLSDLQQQLPFLESIQDDPIDEANFSIYADWLEERGDARAEFLRLFCRFHFHDDWEAGAEAAACLPPQPRGWLYYVFGSPERAREICNRLKQAFPAPQQQSQPSALATNDPTASPARPWWRFW